MEPKKYLKSREITIGEAAAALGYSRPYLTDIVNRKYPAGRKLAEAFEKWSGGAVRKEDLLWPPKADDDLPHADGSDRATVENP